MISIWTWLARSLWFHRRSLSSVIAGLSFCIAVLHSSILMGDSAGASLRRILDRRLGSIETVVIALDRFPRRQLADEIEDSTGRICAPILRCRATLSVGTERIPQLELYGVDERFWALSPERAAALDLGTPDGSPISIALNERAAHRLKLEIGDEAILRFERRSLISRDVPLAGTDDASSSLRVKLVAIPSEAEFGSFALGAEQSTPFNAYLDHKALETVLSRVGRANVFLVGESNGPVIRGLAEALAQSWTLDDIGVQAKVLSDSKIELRSERVFLDDPLVSALPRADEVVFSSFVESISADASESAASVPYSFVAGISGPALEENQIPKLGEDGIAVSDWLAKRLKLDLGSKVEIRSFVLAGRRELKVRKDSFTVLAIYSQDRFDSSTMPDFPGLSDKSECKSWDESLPISLDKIQNSDEDFWRRYRGAPKALLSLESARRLWKNQYGQQTALRYSKQTSFAELERAFRERVAPSQCGLIVNELRSAGLRAADGTVDFSGLFLGLSSFLIGAVLLLAALFYVFNVQSRAQEFATLQALGWPRSRLRSIVFVEAIILTLVAIPVGLLLGEGLLQVLISQLNSSWSGATGGLVLQAETSWSARGVSLLSGLLLATFSLCYSAREYSSRSVLQSLRATGRASESPSRRPIAGLLSLAACIPTIILIDWALSSKNPQLPLFLAAATSLIATLSLACWVIQELAPKPALSLNSLILKGAQRNLSRSLSVVVILGIASFLIIAIGAQSKHAVGDRFDRGTGGFAYYGELSLPLLESLRSPESLNRAGLEPEDLRGCELLCMPRLEGDDASCLNLNKSQRPPVLAVPDADISMLSEIAIQSVEAGRALSWAELLSDCENGEIPVFADNNTVLWALGKSLGDSISTQNSAGRKVKFRIIGALETSIFQGQLLCAESKFLHSFPESEGASRLLLKGPEDRVESLMKRLETQLQDLGLKFESTRDRLEAFLLVENTYIAIFFSLGVLALLVGSIGLGVLVARAVLERRAELAMLRAVGFSNQRVLGALISEHLILLTLGLASGGISGGIACLASTDLPWFVVLGALAGSFSSAGLAILAAAEFSLAGSLIRALRHD